MTTMTKSFSPALRTGITLVLGLTLAVLARCQDTARDRYIKVFFANGKSVTAELAVTDEERARGLMFREKILPDQGMLFVFEMEDAHSFWMKNTLVYLDMLWLDSQRRVIHIEANVPPCKEDPCPSYGPGVPARYVLELKGGGAAASGIKLHDQLQFVLPERVLKILR
jgi:uncharacterized membrane protein (UPF0127 family)